MANLHSTTLSLKSRDECSTLYGYQMESKNLIMIFVHEVLIKDMFNAECRTFGLLSDSVCHDIISSMKGATY